MSGLAPVNKFGAKTPSHQTNEVNHSGDNTASVGAAIFRQASFGGVYSGESTTIEEGSPKKRKVTHSTNDDKTDSPGSTSVGTYLNPATRTCFDTSAWIGDSQHTQFSEDGNYPLTQKDPDGTYLTYGSQLQDSRDESNLSERDQKESVLNTIYQNQLLQGCSEQRAYIYAYCIAHLDFAFEKAQSFADLFDKTLADGFSEDYALAYVRAKLHLGVEDEMLMHQFAKTFEESLKQNPDKSPEYLQAYTKALVLFKQSPEQASSYASHYEELQTQYGTQYALAFASAKVDLNLSDTDAHTFASIFIDKISDNKSEIFSSAFATAWLGFAKDQEERAHSFADLYEAVRNQGKSHNFSYAKAKAQVHLQQLETKSDDFASTFHEMIEKGFSPIYAESFACFKEILCLEIGVAQFLAKTLEESIAKPSSISLI